MGSSHGKCPICDRCKGTGVDPYEWIICEDCGKEYATNGENHECEVFECDECGAEYYGDDHECDEEADDHKSAT